MSSMSGVICAYFDREIIHCVSVVSALDDWVGPSFEESDAGSELGHLPLLFFHLLTLLFDLLVGYSLVTEEPYQRAHILALMSTTSNDQNHKDQKASLTKLVSA